MEQKRYKLTKLCKSVAIAVAIGAGLVAVGGILNVVINVNNSYQYMGEIYGLSTFYLNRIDSQVAAVFFKIIFKALAGLLATAANSAQYMIISKVLFRIGNTGRPFAPENKRNLKWIAILSLAPTLIYAFWGSFSLDDFLIQFAVAVALWCWPEYLEHGNDLQFESDTLL